VDDDLLRRILGDDVEEGYREAYGALIVEQARKLLRPGLPHPEGRNWVDDDAFELTSGFCLSPAYEYVLITAQDDDELRALVYTSLRNLVVAELRKTARARLRRRMKEIMVEEGYVEKPQKFWRRPSDLDYVFAGRKAELAEAAWGVSVQLVRWRSDAKRNGPVAERQSFVDVLAAVLDVAHGSVHEDELLDVVATRFGLGPVSFAEALDVPEEEHGPVDGAPTPEDVAVAEDAELEAAIQASSIWAQLSPDERRLFPHLGKSARAAAEGAGMGKTKANSAMPRLQEKLAVLIGVDEDEERKTAVIRELGHLADGADS